MDYYADIGVQILILVMLGASLNLLMGYAGEVSMAHATFYGVGAYTAGLLALPVATGASELLTSGVAGGAGWSIWPAMVVGIAAAFIVALLVSLPALSRVRGEYLILLTLAFQTVMNQLMVSADGVTGGAYGLTPIPTIDILGLNIAEPMDAFWMLLVSAVAVLVVCYGIGESPFGRLLKGLREHDLVVRSLGKDTVRPKLLIFGVAAAIAGFVGVLNASYYQFIAPGTYDLNFSILIIAVVIIGGISNLTGTILGAILLASLKPILEGVAGDDAIVWQAVIYGLLLVVIIRLRPEGLLPEGAGIRSLFRNRTPGPSLVEAVASAAPDVSARLGPETRAVEGTLAAPPEVLGTALEVSGLSKSFKGLKAVDGVDFDLARGRITALIGPNGAGKTTIFNLITNVIQPDAGKVVLNGEDVTGKKPDQISRLGMARSFQDGRLFERLTALQNVTLAVRGNPGENLAMLALRPRHCLKSEAGARQEAMQALDFVGLGDKSDEIVGNLSFGDQKLVAIARLLATGCEVLLLDEPTSGIDPAAVEGVMDVIRGLRDSGQTVCLVEHSVHMVSQLADHGIFLDQGRKIAEGSIEELMGTKQLTEIYFGT